MEFQSQELLSQNKYNFALISNAGRTEASKPLPWSSEEKIEEIFANTGTEQNPPSRIWVLYEQTC